MHIIPDVSPSKEGRRYNLGSRIFDSFGVRLNKQLCYKSEEITCILEKMSSY